MPRQNRVTPYGELIAVSGRGMFWGNRGPLLDREGHSERVLGRRLLPAGVASVPA